MTLEQGRIVIVYGKATDSSNQMVRVIKDVSLFFSYQTIKNFYQETANLVWNGKAVSGKEAVVKFLEDLPSSKTVLSSMDSQPVLGMLIIVLL